MIAHLRVLQGLYKGFEYNVKIVVCRKPTPCKPVKYLGKVIIKGILEPLVAFTQPATYKLIIEDYEAPVRMKEIRYILLYTLRLRYTEIPQIRVEVKGDLEIWPGGIFVVVPDVGGYIKPLYDLKAGRSNSNNILIY
jgi:hypothetical protein